MAFKVEAGGVTMTRGRGAAKVSLSMSFGSLVRWAKKMKIDTPKLYDKMFCRAAKGLKDKMVQVMKNAGGVCGVPKFKDFEAFTKELREKAKIASRPMGGILSEKSSFFATKTGKGRVVFGWKDYLQKVAENFQDGVGGSSAEKWFTDPQYRRLWHQQGLKEIPRAYVHNPRRVLLQPFGKYADAHMKEWQRGAFHKELARQMEKAGDFK